MKKNCTSFNDSRRLTIGAIEGALEKAFSDYSVRRGFTANIVIDHVKKRDGILIDDVDAALKRAMDSKVKTLVVQPTHLMDGLEYNDLIKQEMEPIYKSIMKTLQIYLHNAQISLTIRIAERQGRVKVLTRREQFELLSKNNPAVEKLRQAFDLELA